MKLKLERPEGISGYDSNVYAHPEIYGLTVVDSIDWSSGHYEFDLTVVWKDGEGRLWVAHDQGCSCPSHFEDTDELDRLYSTEELEEQYQDYIKRDYGVFIRPDEWQAFIQNVKQALKELSENVK